MNVSYIKTVFRYLVRNKEHTLGSIAILSIAEICCLLIGIYVAFEFSYDRFHSHADRIYRVTTEIEQGENTFDHLATTGWPIGELILAEYPEVDRFAVLRKWNPGIESNDIKLFNDGLYASEDFFSLFSFTLLAGDRETALKEPFSIVLTEASAEKYLAPGEPIGQTLPLNDSLLFTVTGIVENIPANSHLQFDLLTSYASLHTSQADNAPGSWLFLDNYTYVQVVPGTDMSAFSRKVAGLLESRFSESMEAMGINAYLGLQPLREIHLRSDLRAELTPNSNIDQVRLLMLVAILIIVIATINFLILSLARSSKVAKEIGIRKTLGGGNKTIVQRFIVESGLLSLWSMVIAFFVTLTVVPFFESFTGQRIGYDFIFSPVFVLVMVSGALLLGMLTGLYPAWALSRMSTVEAIRLGKGLKLLSSFGGKRTITITQFAISIFLVSTSFAIYRQVAYLMHYDPGFEQEEVLILEAKNIADEQFAQAYAPFAAELKELSSVESITASHTIPGMDTWQLLADVPGSSSEDALQVDVIAIDEHYLSIYGIDVVSGKSFSGLLPDNLWQSILLNEEALERLGWSAEEAIGKKMVLNQEKTIVGVFRNYHHYAPSKAVSPMALIYAPPAFDFIAVRVNPSNVVSARSQIAEVWDRFFPEYAMDTYPVGEAYGNQYASESGLLRSIIFFTCIALVLVCLGMYSMTAYLTESRLSEIGVRKAFGASTSRVTWTLISSFLVSLAIALVVTIPVAYYAVTSWLQSYAHQIDRIFLTIVCTGLAAAFIVLSVMVIRALWASFQLPVFLLKRI